MQASGSILEDVRQLHRVSQDVMSHFEQYVQELSAARMRDERFEQSASGLLEKLSDMTRKQNILLEQIGDGIGIMDLLLACKLVPTKSEARRLVQQGGAFVNDEKIASIDVRYDAEALRAGLKIRKGKKVYHKAILGG
jgi:tyrosyl-tRNA synthetase